MAKHCGSSCSDNECKTRRNCACMCSPLQATSFKLRDGCVDACNGELSQIPTSIDDYLCRVFNRPDVLFNQYGMISCGYDFKKSAEFQAKEEGNKLQDTAIKILLAVIIIVLIALIFKG